MVFVQGWRLKTEEELYLHVVPEAEQDCQYKAEADKKKIWLNLSRSLKGLLLFIATLFWIQTVQVLKLTASSMNYRCSFISFLLKSKLVVICPAPFFIFP